MQSLEPFTFDYPFHAFSTSVVIQADSFEWLRRIPPASVHAIVTDPPYGVKEFDLEQLEKRANGNGGIWRIPPSFDGHQRAPMPRFTALTPKERERLSAFFQEWGRLAARALVPGGHIFIASNALLSQLVFSALVAGGLEFRGAIIRLVRTFRGGDRPKHAEAEFPEVCSLPRSCYEPWGIFRNPLPPGMTVSGCLRTYGTGGLRRISTEQPFNDVIISERTPQNERAIANHPSLKPQSFMRQLVRAVLPLGQGIIVDTFMGAGSTVAAAESLGLTCIGVERHRTYFEMAIQAIPRLASLEIDADVSQHSFLEMLQSR